MLNHGFGQAWGNRGDLLIRRDERSKGMGVGMSVGKCEWCEEKDS